VLRARPDLVEGRWEGDGSTPNGRGPKSERGLGLLGYGVLIAAGLAVFVAPFVCPWPDGLESVARRLGFEGQAESPAVPAPMADYQLPGVGSATTATMVAGLIGTGLAFGAAYGLARLLVPVFNSTRKDAQPGN
jgi:hypothetical protein